MLLQTEKDKKVCITHYEATQPRRAEEWPGHAAFGELTE